MPRNRNNKIARSTFSQKKDTLLTVEEQSELMPFLIANLNHKSRNNIKTLLSKKQIFVDEVQISQFNHPLQPKQKVRIKWEKNPDAPLNQGVSIVFEDESIIVIDKRSGMLSVPTNTEKARTAYSFLCDHVYQEHPNNKVFVIHRLDRDVSGLMVFAKTEKVQAQMQEIWRKQEVLQAYVAVIDAEIENEGGVITSYLKESKALKVHSSQDPEYGRKATTTYKKVNAGNGYSMLNIKLTSEQKNQIRVHIQDLGHHIVGDKKYGAKLNPINRLGLHCQKLRFRHPVTDKVFNFTSPVPNKFKLLLKKRD